ncbi:MAG TPA: fumarylacetoacetate hydrolase family protein [Thermoanaerobaculia bacterium]|jgi:fumarylacetoacetate (FAA) hydrolase|nr:fumarylacetoacetate hydrolase family protein [Thermoanaerobaculia bacterium]HPA50702.1 fumarylacetoacetate hydrolase family protein [Thermoanaerobaculia bacterium]HQN07176.1 fumarylacetoacetate hydrolase family protein [Thermoanaerobaculia bacterium]HQP87370.1 fumarylacetoacetate hydrolase family protein [Thermoanaerobaculia bacterium]
MKLVTFVRPGADPAGAPGIALPGAGVLDLGRASETFRGLSMLDLVRRHEELLPEARPLAAGEASLPAGTLVPEDEVRLLAPLPRPVSVRDGYAFRQHVETARRNRGLPMIPEFDEFPVFYFTNALAVIGPGELRVGRRRLEKLDFELECFVVLGKRVTNPTLEEADDAIFGYGVMNDLSARTLQMEEMKLNLGPAKGKDFATAIGPWLVTKDELADRLRPSPKGNVLDARMTAHVNGVQVSEGNVAQMDWTFAQIVQRAADGVTLEPGEVIGSGTVGTGCFLELNGSGITKDQWLRPGDVVSLAIDGLGTLTHTIVEDPEK